jgi:hypothetical protein
LKFLKGSVNIIETSPVHSHFDFNHDVLPSF